MQPACPRADLAPAMRSRPRETNYSKSPGRSPSLPRSGSNGGNPQGSGARGNMQTSKANCLGSVPESCGKCGRAIVGQQSTDPSGIPAKPKPVDALVPPPRDHIVEQGAELLRRAWLHDELVAARIPRR